MYHNSGTGYQKASHERMLNGQGRKVIKEKAGNQFNSYDHYKNMGSDDFQNFDHEWNRVAGQLGFKPNSNALEYGGGDPFANNRNRNYADRKVSN
jgi:metal-dependent amidase/aminoacylase/carboxypeptidase family protein